MSLFEDSIIDDLMRRKLKDSCTAKIAPMIIKGRFFIFLNGAEKIEYIPEENKIILFPPYIYSDPPTEGGIDKGLVRKLYLIELAKLSVAKVNDDEEIKKELHITRKRLSDKDRETIEKYRNAFLIQANK